MHLQVFQPVLWIFIYLLLLVHPANAALNATAPALASAPLLVSESQQCRDIDNCRTLQNIIYGCLSTIFLCTWVALHLNVPRDPTKISPLRRVWYMLGALLCPELVLCFAFSDWTDSSEGLKKILEHSPDCGWTEIHIQFAVMGGFQLVREDGTKEPMHDKAFVNYVSDGTIDVPHITFEEIQDRSKGDTISNIIAVLQAAWFVIQCIHRASRHLPVTELEITTLAHALINFFVYWCWWNKPLGVGLAVDVYAKQPAPVPSDLEHVEHRLGGENLQEMEVEPAADNSQPRSSTRGAGANSLGPVTNTDDNSAPEQNHDVLAFPRPPASSVLSLARDEPMQEDTIALPSPPASTHALYSYDQPRPTTSRDVEDPEKGVLLQSGSIGKEQGGALGEANGLDSNIESPHTPRLHQSLSLRVKLGLRFASLGGDMDTIQARIFWSVVVFSIAGAFGAIHCLAWNSHFPTHAEQIIWQVSSLIVVTIGGGSFVMGLNIPEDASIFEDIDKRVITFIIIVFPCALYCCARICLLVLALLALRSLPFEAFVTPSWPSLIPHIG